MFDRIESGFSLVWINFLWQLNMKFIHTWDVQQQFTLEKENKTTVNKVDGFSGQN